MILLSFHKTASLTIQPILHFPKKCIKKMTIILNQKNPSCILNPSCPTVSISEVKHRSRIRSTTYRLLSTEILMGRIAFSF